MAKTPSKAPAKTAPKKAAPAKKTSTASLESAAEDALKTLKGLGVDPQLQADLEWCLGSYHADKNPTGLYEMIGRAVGVLTTEKEKKSKGATAKLIGDLEKALKSRG